jgi:uncharacterized protein (TIGR02996 family)
MSQHEAFLQHLRAQPDDDTTRLVYADWLEEHDDPRWRYLRLEVELARLAERGASPPELEAELAALGEGIDPGWLASAGKRWDVLLRSSSPDWLIPCVKVVRNLTASDLLEAVVRTKAVPVLVLRDVPRDEAERARQTFAGRAAVELCPASSARRYEVRMPYVGGRAYTDHAADLRAATGWTFPESHDGWSVLLQTYPSWAEAERVRQQYQQLARLVVVVRPGAAE